MSVVAGVSLFDGVMLAADCRVSYGPVRRDVAQKLFLLTPDTAIGYVGDLRSAQMLFPALIDQAGRQRTDPYSISRWLPGFLRHRYAALECPGEIALLVGSVLRGRPNIVERQAAVDLMRRIADRNGPVAMGGFNGQHLIPILSTPPNVHRIRLHGTSRGALYALHSPQFHRERFRTLEFTAIGSGWRARNYISDFQGPILLGIGEFMESDGFRIAVESYLSDRADQTVGGLIPIIKLTGAGPQLLGHRVTANVGTSKEVSIGLRPDASGWTQVNLTTGKERRLLPPWDLPAQLTSGATDDRFDDLLDAFTR